MESSDSEREEEGVWTDDLHKVDITSFEENVGPTNILPEEANCLDFLLVLFPEELIDLIVTEQ